MPGGNSDHETELANVEAGWADLPTDVSDLVLANLTNGEPGASVGELLRWEKDGSKRDVQVGDTVRFLKQTPNGQHQELLVGELVEMRPRDTGDCRVGVDDQVHAIGVQWLTRVFPGECPNCLAASTEPHSPMCPRCNSDPCD